MVFENYRFVLILNPKNNALNMYVVYLYQTEKLKLHSYNFSPTWGEIKRGV